MTDKERDELLVAVAEAVVILGDFVTIPHGLSKPKTQASFKAFDRLRFALARISANKGDKR